MMGWFREFLCDLGIHGKYLVELAPSGARRDKCLYCPWNDVTGGTPDPS